MKLLSNNIHGYELHGKIPFVLYNFVHNWWSFIKPTLKKTSMLEMHIHNVSRKYIYLSRYDYYVTFFAAKKNKSI